MPDDLSMNDVKNKPRKGLLQSLHSLTFSDDSHDDDEDDDTILQDTLNTPVTSTETVDTADASATTVESPTPGVSDNVSSLSSDDVTLENMSKETSKVENSNAVDAKSVDAGLTDTPSVSPMGPSLDDSTQLPDPVSTPFDKKTEEKEDSAEEEVTSGGLSDVEKTPTYNPDVPVEDALADPGVTLDVIESSLSTEVRRSMESVKESSANIKQKTNYDLVTVFGASIRETLVFNTFLTKELPYVSKAGKIGTQRVNFFGVMTESGVYAIRASSAITSKLEDALKHTSGMQDDVVGLLGEGSSRRFVLKLPAEEYGSSNILDVSLIGDAAKQKPESFTGLDAITVDMQFIEDLMTLAISEVEAMLDYEKRRRANLKDLQNKKDVEVRKASTISDKLNTISF